MDYLKLAKQAIVKLRPQRVWTYAEYMQSLDWQLKRQERLDVDNYECRLCGSRQSLEVHHKPTSYRWLGSESVADDLTTLCKGCHKSFHKYRRDRND